MLTLDLASGELVRENALRAEAGTIYTTYQLRHSRKTPERELTTLDLVALDNKLAAPVDFNAVRKDILDEDGVG